AWIGDWLRALEWRSAASGMPLDLGADLFPTWLGQFWALGPLGALADPEPLWTRREPDNDPEARLKEAYVTDWGKEVRWKPVHRTARRSTIPGNEQPYQSGGCVFFLSGAELAAGRGFLEIECDDSLRVLWNGQAVLSRKAGSLSQVGSWFRVPVTFREGTNCLLLVTDGSQWIDVGARLLDENARPLSYQPTTLEELLAAQPADEAVTWGEVQVDPRGALGDGEFDQLVGAVRSLRLGRADLAWASPEPTDPDAHLAWMRLRHSAVAAAGYLPDEVQRQRMVAIEEQLMDQGGLGRSAALRRLERMVQDDKPIEAAQELAKLREQYQPHPRMVSAEVMVAHALDSEGALARRALEEGCQAWPSDPRVLGSLAQEYAQAGNTVLAMETAITALRLGSDEDSIVRIAASGLARRSEDPRTAWLLTLLERRAAKDLSNWSGEERLQDTLGLLGQPELAIERAKVQAQAHPEDVSRWERLLRMLSEQGTSFGDATFDQALAQVERLEPAYDASRTLRRLAGQPVTADAFFRAFAPDEAFAWQVSKDLEKASTVEILDSGLVYLYPDGSRVGRVFTVTKAEDRSGTEALHEVGASGMPLLARVKKADGSMREPVMVQGKWVMPSLDPGDAVELRFEWEATDQWGAPVSLDSWRFASLEKPFGLSRYVVFVPEGLKVELRTKGFLGTHVTEPWGGGTVHILSAEKSPRREAEPLMPSELEVLPVAQFGQDLSLAPVEQRWRQIFRSSGDLPLEVTQGLDRWVADLDPNLAPDQRAEALFLRLFDELVDFDGNADPSRVWFTKRGQPILLFAALLKQANIPFEWALLQKGVSPELDPSPVTLFANEGGFEQILLRIPGSNGVHWQIPPTNKGVGFGQLPETMAGAKALILEPEG
ncbi:MAG TPA: hypothetical protein P5218_09720, partial [Planctomycetota bacterium]|nr:hypothetical protein [Planctomycetota bacterium]